jgi:hypothetical protein
MPITKTLADARAIMSGLIQDQGGKLSTTARNQSIQAAVELHSTFLPRVKVQVMTGVSNDRSAVPTGWIDDVSELLRVEYPLHDTPPTYLEAEDDVTVITAPTATSARFKLLFLNDVPGATERFAVHYTKPHIFGATASQNTIQDNHIQAISYLAAALACKQLAAFYSQSGDNLIQADSVNSQQKNPSYLNLSRAYFDYYYTFFKIDPNGKARAAGINVDMDRKFSFGGEFFTHPRHWR